MSINSNQSSSLSWTQLFRDRTAILATMHRKEVAIAPILEQEMGVSVQVPKGLNTDLFGTFTREIVRTGNQLEAARQKVEQALKLTGESLGIASEGSFGPHPSFPWLACDRELVILIDREHDLEIVGEVLVLETNYRQQQVKSWEEAIAFAKKVGFPQHGLVAIESELGKDSGDSVMTKGIIDEPYLQEIVNRSLRFSAALHLETDMRAMYNPTRMRAIEQATWNLLANIKQICPQCDSPGFSIIERRSGLPCAFCSAPTSLVRAVLYHCKKCDFVEEVLFPDGVKTADPEQCAYCNP